MRRTRFEDWVCPIARATDVVGDWWTPLVMREVFMGRRRFAEMAESLGVPRAVLTARLARLCDEGMLRRVEYQANPPRFEYRLTDKGRAFGDVLLAMWQWGSDWLWDGEAPPLVLKDVGSGEQVEPVVADARTGTRLRMNSVRIGRNPAAADRPG